MATRRRSLQAGAWTLGLSGLVLLLILTGAAARRGNQIWSLATLRKVDARPLYELHYFGDYGFGEFTKQGARNDQELESWVMRRLTFGRSPKQANPPGFSCTVFSARNGDGEVLAGRNFDHPYMPILLLYTSPPGGYASISLVDLAYAGYSKTKLPDSSLSGRIRLLAAPYLPFDGLNEAGLFIALLAVPSAEPSKDPLKPTLNTTTAIRLVLDHAKTVDEAVRLLSGFNLYFSGDIAVHYLVADSAGDTAVLEFVDGRVKAVRSGKPWNLATNFVLSDPAHPGDGQDRYAVAEERLASAKGIVSSEAAMDLLKAVVIPGKTKWSAVYNLTARSLDLAVGEEYTKVRHYVLVPGY